MSEHIHPQHKLSDLIGFLQKQLTDHGDLPVVYWDQDSSVTFSDITHLTQIKDEILYFGGFHVNGSRFCEFDPFIGSAGVDNYANDPGISLLLRCDH